MLMTELVHIESFPIALTSTRRKTVCLVQNSVADSSGRGDAERLAERFS